MEKEAAEEQANLCEECNTNASKYKCPGCSLRTCSLPCVNAHKKRTSCTGKRSLSHVVPISHFDDALLLSDYNMLEEVKRMAESAKRMRFTLCGQSHFNLPWTLKSLRGAASGRRIRLLFLPTGMLRREKNKTCYNTRKKSISWTLEWRFHSTDVVLIDHGVHENKTLLSVIENHLKPGPWNHPLKRFCDETLDSLKFFICKYPKGQRSPYRQLNIKEPLGEQLRDLVILEYPVIHVFLPSESYDFEVIREKIPSRPEIKEPGHDDSSCHKSVTYREEEIKEEESTAPIISDLMDNAYQSRQGDVEPNETLQGLSHIIASKDENIGNKSCIEQLNDIGDADFDLGPGVMDMFSEIISEGNSEDFLNLDGLLAGQLKDLDGEFMLGEELEEGEIV